MALRASFAMRIGFSVAAGVLILAGASMNVAGRSGADVLVPAIAGLMAAAAGGAYSGWGLAGPAGVRGLLVAVLSGGFQFHAQAPAFGAGGPLLRWVGG